jgi:Sulfotransferase domain
MMQSTLQALLHQTTVLALRLLPDEKRVPLERRMRGRYDAQRLARADVCVISYGKSGRTWARVMLSRYFQLRYAVSPRRLLTLDNYHRQNAAIPVVMFTHDNYLRDFTGTEGKSDFQGKKLVVLVRHPADTAVSQYFQWRYRMKPGKKALNDYPPHGTEISVQDFVLRHPAGLERVVSFANRWAKELFGSRDILLVRYEDLRRDTAGQLRRILNFMGEQPTDKELGDAVAFASLENMRKLEERSTFWRSGSVLKPGERGNVDSYKVRRGKVGGFRDYFTDAEVAQIEQYVRERLDPIFGYGGEAQSLERAVAAGAST